MTKESKELSVFERLSAINVNDKVEKKNGLTYLSWAWAWSEVKKAYPNASYEVVDVDMGVLGIMCTTSVTIEGQTLRMWLPVMDSNNKAMKVESYTYSTKYGEKTVEAATMFDVNKTLMRCLVKNLAMFGLGIYIYAGEDLPESETAQSNVQSAPQTAQSNVQQSNKLALEIGDSNWDRVVKYAVENKSIGAKKIVESLSVKYQISPSVKAEITKLIGASK
jgi:hypothetical protein